MGGIVKTLRRSNSLSCSIFCIAGSVGYWGVAQDIMLIAQERKVGKIPAPVQIKLALPPPPSKKPTTPPPKTRNFMGMGVFLQKEPKMPGAHKIGAAISGLSGPYRAMRAAMRCERRCGLNPEMAMRCDAESLAMHILAAEILCDALR